MILRLLVLLVALSAVQPTLGAADHGVVLLYHHVSESTPPSTSVTPDRFRQHLDYLSDNGFNVIPLRELLSKGLSGDPLPDNAVAITFDDAYISVFTEAAPMLAQREWPFTVFLASQPLDDEVQGYMSWPQAGKLLEMGGEIGGHSHSHDYLVRRQDGENDRQWRRRVETEIDQNLQRITAELGIEVTAFAYPFGEYNRALKSMVAKRGLHGLAQQSGAVGLHTDPRQVPRFPMATSHDDVERLKLAIHSQPLPVLEQQREGNVMMLELARSDLPTISCFSADGEILSVSTVDEIRYRVELPPTRAGRNKANCTAPTGASTGEFYWYSYLWLGD
ncbi:polysaccharide deacetylase family protein [Haliea sp. E1-2-M8]|uniref:polysaccharide deacetylase family protein n=1 Tax=Haliea sp. E1-2-M8 TaxID=3064706 RepID=UPI002723A93C|nr:polysaccharide deacetylase family protein [Haliea sp. E1-2-M8]MDO8862990.1 polysaccharide deacetylase family protein [Haliea sp. E1-2-M8]